jgi:hypothetical protein
MDIVPSFANEDWAIVFYARHSEGPRPLKVLLEGFGSSIRDPGMRLDAALAAGRKKLQEWRFRQCRLRSNRSWYLMHS